MVCSGTNPFLAHPTQWVGFFVARKQRTLKGGFTFGSVENGAER
jgi:hypothetical protein